MLWRGKPWQLLRLAESGKVELCIAYQMLLELDEVLAYPQFENRLALLETTPAQLAAFAMNISAAFEVSRTGLPIVQADPDDDVFLLCAAAADRKSVV